MKKYKYQLHCHTKPCSACATMDPAELIDGLLSGGFDGCVLTNHFYNGNSGIERNLTWNEFVYQYEKDYLECKKIAQNNDLDIIFGIEQNVGGGLEILCYGITPQFLYDNPQLHANPSIEDWYHALRDFGALCIQAHPFRERGYITTPGMLPIDLIDGIEVYNFGNKPNENVIAQEFADNNAHLIVTAGADAHWGSYMSKAGIETEVRIKDEKTLVQVLKSGNYKLIKK